jgi:hypothetical protein
VKWLFDGTPIVDLNVLGQFGQRLLQYQQLSEKLNINPFKYTQLRKQTKPIALEVMQEMLLEKGFVSTVKHRGRNLALSFELCPACGKKSGNAVAYPPYYTLKCFKTNCPAFEGLPLIKWAGIRPRGYHNYKGKKLFDLRPPSEFVAINEARKKITDEIKGPDNSYIILTPGVGKTHQAVHVTVEMAKDKIIIYSTVSKALQNEVCELAKKISGDKNLIHLIQAREDCCKREEKLKEITKKGFSPAELLCSSCNHRNVDCSYYQQRANFDNGVYFVTHQMLMYLEDRIPYPDLIILDENIKSGFFLGDSCSREQMLSIHKIQNDKASILLDKLMELSDEIVKNLFKGDIS